MNKNNEIKEKVKENAWFDFSKMVENSWTFKRMTKEEQLTFDRIIRSEQAKKYIKGSYSQRMNAFNYIYSVYLAGLGYNGYDWRETHTKEAET